MLEAGPFTVAARQADAMTLLGRAKVTQLSLSQGKLSPDELFNDIGRESSSAYSGLMMVGGLVTFIGFFSILMRTSPNMDLRPKL